MANRQLFKATGLKNSERGSLFLLFLWLFILAACQPHSQLSVLSGATMGTTYRISVVSDKPLDKADLEQQLFAEIDAVDQRMSTYKKDSELNQLNSVAAGRKTPLSHPLYEVLKQAIEVGELSKGAFDITVQPLVDLWGFGPTGRISQQPSKEKLQELAQFVGYSKLTLNGKSLIKSHSQIQLDLSAIAKGYAVDRVARRLDQLGYQDYLVEIGGELRARGYNQNAQIWRVGIAKPQVTGGIQQLIKLDNKAIATSGDYLNYLLIDGEKFSHTIDPTTLSPALHKLALVSVLHQQTSIADALATAMMAMGEERAWQFAQTNNLSVYMLVRDNSEQGFHTRISEGFKACLE